MISTFSTPRKPSVQRVITAVVGVLFLSAACSTPVNPGGGNTGTGNNGAVTNALGFDGTLSGKIADSQSTRNSLTDAGAQQEAPPTFDTDDTTVYFMDMSGDELTDENGQPIEPVSVDTDGSFEAENLPVGVDFTVCADIGTDGSCDIRSCVNIPSEDGGGSGSVDDVRADPLTTLILAKLQQLLAEKGIDINDLPISPVAVVTRIVDAYTHLFEESGIDQGVELDEIASVTANQLAELFDTIIPASVRNGMALVEGNLDLARAADLNARAVSIAEVFLRAGFPIGDGPGEPDLSSLAALDGVESHTPQELFAQSQPFTEEFTSVDEELNSLEPAGFGDAGDMVIYVNTLAEPDRNLVGAEDDDESEDEKAGPHLPVLNDHLLFRMARLQQDDRQLTLGDLYELITSLLDGLGVRVTYFVFDPNFFGPPLDIFETSDGQGKALNLQSIFRRVSEGGFAGLAPEALERRDAELRQLLQDLLAGTVAPEFDRLFEAIVRDRVGSVDEFASQIRDARAHLPFSRSGPSEFFVVADGDAFKGDEDVSPVTVDADIDLDGKVLSVSYNAAGDGAYWLGFTPRTEERGVVDLILRETGRVIHGVRGIGRLRMSDEDVFQAVDGQPFIQFVSETGNFYPGVNISVFRQDFKPMSFPMGDHLGGMNDRPPFGGESTTGETQPPTDISDESSEDTTSDTMSDAGDESTDTDESTSTEDTTDEVPLDDTASETTADGESTPAQEVPESGPNQQIFVLATDVGPGAQPVRVTYDADTGVASFDPNGKNLLMFLPDTQNTGLFALFNEKTGRPASESDPSEFFQGFANRPDRLEDVFNNFDFADFMGMGTHDVGDFVDQFLQNHPPDGDFRPEDGFMPPDGFFPPDGFIPPDGFLPPDGTLPPPDETTSSGDDGSSDPAQFDGEESTEDVADDGASDELIDDTTTGDDGAESPTDEIVESPTDDGSVGAPPPGGSFDTGELILISVDSIQNLPQRTGSFTHVFGTNVPNERYDPTGDPYYDDINANGQEDADEPTSQFRPTLFDPADWRSTDIRLYYRRADNNESVTFEEINFESATPLTLDGVALVARNYLPRLNAFRFGRPNTAINLLTAFLPADFFDGTHSLNRDTQLDVLSSIAIINLVMDQVINVEADIDVDGFGPLQKQSMLTDGHFFIAPIGDPFVLLLKGFNNRAAASSGM